MYRLESCAASGVKHRPSLTNPLSRKCSTSSGVSTVPASTGRSLPSSYQGTTRFPGILANPGLDRQRAGHRVDRRPRAQRHGQLAVAVSDAETAQHRYTQISQPIAHRLRGGPATGAVTGRVELSDRDPGDALQRPDP